MKTMKIKKVLISLEIDPSAQKVAETGFSFAESVGAEIILLQVILDPEHYSSGEHITITGFAGFKAEIPLKFDSIDELKIVSQAYLDALKRHLGNDDLQTLVKEGDFAETILKTAKGLHADVIVMGSHNRKVSNNEVSVTEIVLNQTSIPLFIVPVKKMGKQGRR